MTQVYRLAVNARLSAALTAFKVLFKCTGLLDTLSSLKNLYAAEHSVHLRFTAFGLNKLPPRAVLLEISSRYNQTTANPAVTLKPSA